MTLPSESHWHAVWRSAASTIHICIKVTTQAAGKPYTHSRYKTAPVCRYPVQVTFYMCTDTYTQALSSLLLGERTARDWATCPRSLFHIDSFLTKTQEQRHKRHYWLPRTIHTVWSQQSPFLEDRWMHGLAVQCMCSAATAAGEELPSSRGRRHQDDVKRIHLALLWGSFRSTLNELPRQTASWLRCYRVFCRRSTMRLFCSIW